jgi:hypothetical protein
MVIGLLLISVRQVFGHISVGTLTTLRLDAVPITTTENAATEDVLIHVTTPSVCNTYNTLFNTIQSFDAISNVRNR